MSLVHRGSTRDYGNFLNCQIYFSIDISWGVNILEYKIKLYPAFYPLVLVRQVALCVYNVKMFCSVQG